jgi:hypothetical protein
MLKWITTVITFLMLAGNMSPSVSPCKTVTEISVQWIQDGQISRKTYTSPEKTDSLLLYLRAIESSTGSITPEAMDHADCTLQILLSDETVKICQLHGLQYFCEDGGFWQNMKPESALRLYLFLAATPGD